MRRDFTAVCFCGGENRENDPHKVRIFGLGLTRGFRNAKLTTLAIGRRYRQV
jgi:hypothetical protein